MVHVTPVFYDLSNMISGVCKIFEEYLKRMNPNAPSITYDISDLFEFIEKLADLSCLVSVSLLV